ncbi:Protein MON2 homolog [Rhizoctonia solani]|uniref:Protein MON2 homolog n=1 Tax=Rhizoctonia solani TaxID=456999 RepID=A0A0K6GC97_9AGAM|nr:Protein MON2 homolog [Rhizoctonia solani]
MSSLSFLVTELQGLASETRRKHPEIREAAERSLTILRASPDTAIHVLHHGGAQADEVLKPVFMGCATRNSKVVAISIGSFQRLISMRAVPQSSIPSIISILSDSISQGVDIQLKILQTLLSLLTNFPDIHDGLLADALLLCFRLQESRIAVVSSTAAATLRQLVMFIFDKVTHEHSSTDIPGGQSPTKLAQLPDGSSARLAPSAHDAFAIFQDLCLLANSERPLYLQLEALPKTFSLELIESVLTNYYELFKSRSELLLLLRHHLSPLLLKSLSDRPHFPLTLRSTRVVFILLKQFSVELETESEVFLMLFIKVVSGDSDSGEAPRPHWMRVLAMEIVRGLCSDEDLMRGIWERYDSRGPGSSGVFSALITALRRLATEKPGLLGVSSQMGGTGVSTRDAAADIAGSNSVYGGNVGLVAGMVANAATTTISGVVGMMAGGPGLSVPGSSMKLQCIDQLDKADSPIIPETYIYLLSLQCFVSLSDSLTASTLQQYTNIVLQRPRAAGEAIIRAPPALDLSTLPEADVDTQQLRSSYSMLESGWPGLLAALSFFITTNLSEELFADVLLSMQNLTNATGALGLTVPRDAFMTSLSRFAVPSKVVSSLESYVEPSTPRTPGVADSMGLTALSGGPATPPGLSDRNLACLKTFISITLFLAGSLGASWFDVIELLQNADYVLTAKGARSMSTAGKRSSMLGNPALGPKLRPSGAPPTIPTPSSTNSTPRHPLFVDLEPETILAAIERVFDASKSLEDSAFGDFIHALCKLSAAMVGMQSDTVQLETTDDPKSSSTMLQAVSSSDNLQRRRASGIHVTRTLRTGDYGIAKLGVVALLNVHRLAYRDPEVAWNIIIKHLLSVIGKGAAPPGIRMQAAEVLDEILTVVPRNLSSAGELQSQVQNRVLNALSAQVTLEGPSSTVVDIRKLGLDTLHTILQFSGHTLVTGWDTIFAMLGNVCKPIVLQNTAPGDEIVSIKSPVSSVPSTPRQFKPPPLQPKNSSVLVRIAFQSMTLMCDNLDVLSPEHLRLCISTLGLFGCQPDTNIALTAAESLLWSVSDSVQAKRSDPEKEEAYSQLWMFLLLELLGLCSDSRPEVRNGSIQTLFRTLQFYGATLSAETWNECMWKIVFPLMSALTAAVEQALAMLSPEIPLATNYSVPASKTWYETKTLAFQSIASILNDFLVTKIMHLEDYDRGWARFLEIVTDSVLVDDRTTSTAALRCLEKGLISMNKAEGEANEAADNSKEQTWAACHRIGSAIEQHTSPSGPAFTQECLQAFADVIKVLHASSSPHWNVGRFRRCLTILKSIIAYPSSPDYRPDIDGLTPVQSVVLDAVLDFDLNLPGLPSLVLADLSEFATLAFLAAFDVPDTNPNGDARRPPRRVTYIALAKHVMPVVVEIYSRFKAIADIYEDGTLDHILSAYSIPIKLKYDCPAPSKFGNDPPLWKTATTCVLRVIRDSTLELPKLDAVSNSRIEAIWRQIIDVFRGGLLADCSAAESLPLDVQDAEENFDLALLSSLEVDVVPHLGGIRVPDHVITQFARILHAASALHAGGSGPRSNAGSESWEEEDATTESMRSVPRERFAYWAFDLLTLVCAVVETDRESERRRVAALCLPLFLERCEGVLVKYVRDEAVRGNVPFPRVREEEVLYVLRLLLKHQLWSGSLWAAYSDSPSKHAANQPPVDLTLSPALLVADAARRSPRAHLHKLFHVLVDIAALDAAAKIVGESDDGEKVSARELAKQCLRVVGTELGAGPQRSNASARLNTN